MKQTTTLFLAILSFWSCSKDPHPSKSQNDSNALYYTEGSLGALIKLNLGTLNADTLVKNIGKDGDLAYDPSSRIFYFSAPEDGTISSWQEGEEAFEVHTDLGAVQGLTIKDATIYWAADKKVFKGDMNGAITPIEVVLINEPAYFGQGLFVTCYDLEVDDEETVYYADVNDDYGFWAGKHYEFSSLVIETSISSFTFDEVDSLVYYASGSQIVKASFSKTLSSGYYSYELSNEEILFDDTDGITILRDIIVDKSKKRIYWSEAGSEDQTIAPVIAWGELDGSGERHVIADNTNTYGMVLK